MIRNFKVIASERVLVFFQSQNYKNTLVDDKNDFDSYMIEF